MTGGMVGLTVLAIVVLQRVAELALSRRNARWALACGGVESGQAHFRVMVAFHALFLAACFFEPRWANRPFHPALAAGCIVALVLAQALRWWSISTLGPRWNTRVIVVPGVMPVTSGPYRWLRHPNYVAVIVEMITLPLVQGSWITAVVATLGNALLLRTRIAVEERALGETWMQAFRGTPRWIPRGGRARA